MAAGNPAHRRMIRGILFATILIDIAGFSILIPVLPLFATQLGATGQQVALMLALHSLGLVLFSPVWGWVSDRIGRRPVLILCLAGTAASFALLAVANTIEGIYVARALGGFFAASVGTAQAYMTDITEHHERAEGIGLIGAAFGLGFIAGNVLGGTLAAVNPGLPFWTTAGLAFANCALAIPFLPESRPPGTRASWSKLGRALIPVPVLLAATVHRNRTRVYLYLFFHVFLFFSALEAMFTLYANARFGWNELQAGLFMAYIGVVIAATQGLAIGRLTRTYGEVRLVLAGLALTGGCMILFPLAVSLPAMMGIGGLVAFGNGIAFPAFTSLFTKVCGEDEAGESLGQGNAMAQTGRTIGALAAGWVFVTVSPSAVFVIGGIGILAAFIVFFAGLRLLVPRRGPE
jgi:DHA1 family tetracycline resistance protein-like MFS transporter